MARCRAALGVAMVIACAARTAAAQELRGTVRDSASGQPIRGAVVQLLDADGKALGRNLTTEAGRFRMPLDPRMRRVQVLRIGFRPRDLAVPTPESGVAQLDVRMAAIPTLLESVRVVDAPQCPRRPDRAAAFALWDQARTALLATVVARDADPAMVTRLQFYRTFDPDGRRALSQSVQTDSASTTRAFVASRPAADFVTSGFTTDSGGRRFFHGPDADVLLDDAFGAAYCFRIMEPDRARPGQVGLGMSAARHQRGRVDIDGAVWIDTARRVLTDLVYRYDGLDSRLERLDPGGHVSFLSMDNGTVLVHDWSIRLVNAVESSGQSSMASARAQSVEVHETGGTLAHAAWPDGRDWQATLGVLRGQAMQGGRAAAGVTVQLIDTDYRATTDASGEFEIANLVPGPYSIGVVDSALATLGIVLGAHAEFTATNGVTVTKQFEVPTAADYVAEACRTKPGAALGSVIGRVTLPDGSPAPKARWALLVMRNNTWQSIATGVTGDEGLFHACAVPRNQLVQFEISHDGAGTLATSRTIADELTTLTLQLPPRR